MPRIKFDLDTETYDSLVSDAQSERRPVQLHAEVLIRRSLGLPFPVPVDSASTLDRDVDSVTSVGNESR